MWLSAGRFCYWQRQNSAIMLSLSSVTIHYSGQLCLSENAKAILLFLSLSQRSFLSTLIFSK